MSEPDRTYLPRGGLPSEELVVEGAVRWIKSGLQVDAAIGYGLQRGGAFVREAEPNEELHGVKEKWVEREKINRVAQRFRLQGLPVSAHLGLPEELLQLRLRQQAVVLDEGGDLRGALRLVVDRPVDLHVAVESGQEFLLSL